MDVNDDGKATPPKRPTRELMGYVRSGLAYLDRYGGPAARVRRTLERRARRKGLEGEEARDIVDAAMAKLDGLGVLDDAAFAVGKAAALRRRGASRRGTLAKLRAAGVAAEAAAAALADIDDRAGDDPERQAAARYAERRRLGPWRLDPGDRTARRDRDIAALARAGFPVSLAIAVIDGRGE